MKPSESKPQTGSGDQVQASRRMLIRAVATAGGAAAAATLLPEKWSKPIVESVEVPVHAQASPCPAAEMWFASPTEGANIGAGSTSVQYEIRMDRAVAGVVFAVSTTTATTVQVVTTSVTTNAEGRATGTFRTLDAVGPGNLRATTTSCSGPTFLVNFNVVGIG